MDALHVVDFMDLEEGHILTETEASAIQTVLSMATNFRNIQRALGIEEE